MKRVKIGSIVILLFLLACTKEKTVDDYLSDIKKAGFTNKYHNIDMGFGRGNWFRVNIDTSEVYMFISNNINKSNLSWFTVKPNIYIKDTAYFLTKKIDTIAHIVDEFKKYGLIGFSHLDNCIIFDSKFDRNDTQFIFVYCRSPKDLEKVKLLYEKTIIPLEKDWYYFKKQRRKNS